MSLDAVRIWTPANIQAGKPAQAIIVPLNLGPLIQDDIEMITNSLDSIFASPQPSGHLVDMIIIFPTSLSDCNKDPMMSPWAQIDSDRCEITDHSAIKKDESNIGNVQNIIPNKNNISKITQIPPLRSVGLSFLQVTLR